jgi:hypothetical protein
MADTPVTYAGLHQLTARICDEHNRQTERFTGAASYRSRDVRAKGLT